MAFRIFVGNLSYEVTDDDLRDAFSEYGTVTYHRVILDRETQRSRGFGFVEFETSEIGERAISELEGRDLKGRSLRLREAEPRTESGGGGPRQDGRRPEGRRPERSGHDFRRPKSGPGQSSGSDESGGNPSRERRRTEKKAHSRRPEDERKRPLKSIGDAKPQEKQRGGARNRFGFADEDEDEDIDLFSSYHEDQEYDVGDVEGVEIEGDEEHVSEGINLEGIEIERSTDDEDEKTDS